MKYAWIEQHRDSYSVTLMCQLLGVSRSGVYAARVRGASARARSDEQLLEEIRRRQHRHRGRYGRRRMRRELSAALGEPINEKRVGRLMRQGDLQSRKRRRLRVVTTDSKHGHAVAPNVLARSARRIGAPLRPRRAVRGARLPQRAGRARHHGVDESHGRLLGKRSFGAG